jgi:hypothetical protein
MRNVSFKRFIEGLRRKPDSALSQTGSKPNAMRLSPRSVHAAADSRRRIHSRATP